MSFKTSSELLEEIKSKLIPNYSATTQGNAPIGAIDSSMHLEIKIIENASNYVRLGQIPNTFSTTQKLVIEKGLILLERERLIYEEEERSNYITIGG